MCRKCGEFMESVWKVWRECGDSVERMWSVENVECVNVEIFYRVLKIWREWVKSLVRVC